MLSEDTCIIFFNLTKFTYVLSDENDNNKLLKFMIQGICTCCTSIKILLNILIDD